MIVGRIGHLLAAQAAAQALNDLGLNQSQPVDPFEAINALGLQLQFEPLGDLLGAIIPGANPGVLINSARPASVQRFTAAHEIGHWYLDQDALAIDTQENIEGMPAQQRERNAQVFASHFLMPLELFYTAAAEHGVTKGGAVAPLKVYEMARDMHVSYRAAVFQLVNCNFINAHARDDLLRVQPAQLKTALTHGRRPANTRGDVWAVDDLQGSVELEVFVGDEIVVALPENPSTGYRWLEASNLSRPQAVRGRPPARFGSDGRSIGWRQNPSNVTPLRAADEVEPVLARVADSLDAAPAGSPILVGAPTVRRFGFSATRPGESDLELDHVRPFSEATPVESILLKAHVRALPEVEERQRKLLSFARDEAIGESTSS